MVRTGLDLKLALVPARWEAAANPGVQTGLMRLVSILPILGKSPAGLFNVVDGKIVCPVE